MSGCLCKMVQYIFISGQVHAPPFSMHTKIAHPQLSMLRISLPHFLRLRRVEDADAGYRRRVYFIKMRSATVNLRTVWDIHRFNVDAISIVVELLKPWWLHRCHRCPGEQRDALQSFLCQRVQPGTGPSLEMTDHGPRFMAWLIQKSVFFFFLESILFSAIATEITKLLRLNAR